MPNLLDRFGISDRQNLSFAKRNRALIVETDDKNPKVVYCPDVSSEIIIELRRSLHCPVEFEVLSNEEYDGLLTKITESNASSAEEMMVGIDEELDLSQLIDELPKSQDLLESEDDAPIIRLLNALLTQAIKQNASDIHFETFENNLVVRYRIDGILHEVIQPQRILAPLIISRIKVLAKLDIAEKRVPQDGRFTLRIAGHAVDLRVSTMPTAHGERVVLRLLDKQAAHLDLKDLGMGENNLQLMENMIAKPHGIILVTGPTGSGKTTTLYAALTRLNNVARNILTVEDPIEYFLPGIGQTQVNIKVAMTFAKGLRAILRQDPDVVMVGEIRDLETAEIGVQASLTGHLVLSTLHTNTAIGAVLRLHDMGIEPFLISSSLVGVVAQRLVRLLCSGCKRGLPATQQECEILGVPLENPPTLYQPQGCSQCADLGYTGRTGIYEIIPMDDTLRQMIHENVGEAKLETYARSKTPSISEDGYRRVLLGDTALEEVLRVTQRD